MSGKYEQDGPITIPGYLVNADSPTIEGYRSELSTWDPLVLIKKPDSSSDIYSVAVCDAKRGNYLGDAHYAKGRKIFNLLCEDRPYTAHVVRIQEMRSYTKVFFEAHFERAQSVPLTDNEKNPLHDAYLEMAKTKRVQEVQGCRNAMIFIMLLSVGIILWLSI